MNRVCSRGWGDKWTENLMGLSEVPVFFGSISTSPGDWSPVHDIPTGCWELPPAPTRWVTGGGGGFPRVERLLTSIKCRDVDCVQVYPRYVCSVSAHSKLYRYNWCTSFRRQFTFPLCGYVISSLTFFLSPCWLLHVDSVEQLDYMLQWEPR
jgi:hypothetical protein